MVIISAYREWRLRAPYSSVRKARCLCTCILPRGESGPRDEKERTGTRTGTGTGSGVGTGTRTRTGTEMGVETGRRTPDGNGDGSGNRDGIGDRKGNDNGERRGKEESYCSLGIRHIRKEGEYKIRALPFRARHHLGRHKVLTQETRRLPEDENRDGDKG